MSSTAGATSCATHAAFGHSTRTLQEKKKTGKEKWRMVATTIPWHRSPKSAAPVRVSRMEKANSPPFLYRKKVEIRPAGSPCPQRGPATIRYVGCTLHRLRGTTSGWIFVGAIPITIMCVRADQLMVELARRHMGTKRGCGPPPLGVLVCRDRCPIQCDRCLGSS